MIFSGVIPPHRLRVSNILHSNTALGLMRLPSKSFTISTSSRPHTCGACDTCVTPWWLRGYLRVRIQAFYQLRDFSASRTTRRFSPLLKLTAVFQAPQVWARGTSRDWQQLIILDSSPLQYGQASWADGISFVPRHFYRCAHTNPAAQGHSETTRDL